MLSPTAPVTPSRQPRPSAITRPDPAAKPQENRYAHFVALDSPATPTSRAFCCSTDMATACRAAEHDGYASPLRQPQQRASARHRAAPQRLPGFSTGKHNTRQRTIAQHDNIYMEPPPPLPPYQYRPWPASPGTGPHRSRPGIWQPEMQRPDLRTRLTPPTYDYPGPHRIFFTALADKKLVPDRRPIQSRVNNYGQISFAKASIQSQKTSI